jgi:hypothetical protein
MDGPFCTLAGAPVPRAILHLPRSGAWHADVVVDAETLPAGKVTLALGDTATWSGVVAVGGPVLGAGVLRVVGGAGGLARTVSPKAYRASPLRIPLADVLEAVGERLASTSDAGMLAAQLAYWIRLELPAALALAALAAQAGAVWRTLASGEVWVGRELWPAAPTGLMVLGESPAQRRMEFPLTPELVPGMLLEGGRTVEHVEHSVAATKMRTFVWYGARDA